VRWVPLALLAVSVSVFADTPAPRSAWAAWVGDWQGKLRWTGCTVDGEPAASIAIDVVDGAAAIDLAPAGGALDKVALEPDTSGAGDAWRGRAGDVAVHVARGGNAATLELAVDLESGCSIRGSLHRTSVGIAACDELEAWARIENRCTRLVKPPLENLSRVAHQRAEWSKADAEARVKLAGQCKARASKVEAELAAASCAPDLSPVPARFPECGALRLSAAKVTRCQALAFDVATSLAHDANALVDATAGTDGSTSSHDVLEKQCRAMRESLVATAQQAGCSL
jgi:hypothetical protein